MVLPRRAKLWVPKFLLLSTVLKIQVPAKIALN